jgi:CDGSH-type Zn-finger protein
VEAGRAIALCRCGPSREKPFCDRSHREPGFRSCERA